MTVAKGVQPTLKPSPLTSILKPFPNAAQPLRVDEDASVVLELKGARAEVHFEWRIEGNAQVEKLSEGDARATILVSRGPSAKIIARARHKDGRAADFAWTLDVQAAEPPTPTERRLPSPTRTPALASKVKAWFGEYNRAWGARDASRVCAMQNVSGTACEGVEKLLRAPDLVVTLSDETVSGSATEVALTYTLSIRMAGFSQRQRHTHYFRLYGDTAEHIKHSFQKLE
jgi:hypothetical protein